MATEFMEKHMDLLQQKMLLRLKEIRATHHHNGNKGANAEQILRDFLRDFLPPYNRVGRGEVIDQLGNNSRQLDVIVTNEHHPFLNDLTTDSVFFIEGVACVAEVKSVLTGDELQSALENSLSFKQLAVNVPPGALWYCTPEDMERFVNSRPSFLFAFESRLAVPTIIERIRTWNRTHDLPLSKQIDAVFILGGGSIINCGAGRGTLQVITTDGSPATSYIASNALQDKALVALLSWISASLPRLSLPHPPILQYLVKSHEEIRQSPEATGETPAGKSPI